MDKEFEKFLRLTAKPYSGVCTFTADFLVEHEKDIRDAMYIASQAIKFGFIEVEKDVHEDGSWTRVFTINTDGKQIDELEILGYIETANGRLIPVCNPAREWGKKQDKLLICRECGVSVRVQFKSIGEKKNDIPIVKPVYERVIVIDGENRTCMVCNHKYTVNTEENE